MLESLHKMKKKKAKYWAKEGRQSASKSSSKSIGDRRSRKRTATMLESADGRNS